MKYLIRKEVSEVFRLYKEIACAPFHKLPAEVPKMRSMRGNVKSRCWIIAPHPLEEEYSRQMPLTSREAARFHQMLKDLAEFDTEEDSLVFTCSVFGNKPLKGSTDSVRAFVLESVKRNLFDRIVCVGSDPFRFIFGRGKKPSMTTLAGSIIHHADLGNRPLFTFPDLSGLVVRPTESTNPRDLRYMADFEDKRYRLFSDMISRFKSRFGITVQH